MSFTPNQSQQSKQQQKEQQPKQQQNSVAAAIAHSFSQTFLNVIPVAVQREAWELSPNDVRRLFVLSPRIMMFAHRPLTSLCHPYISGTAWRSDICTQLTTAEADEDLVSWKVTAAEAHQHHLTQLALKRARGKEAQIAAFHGTVVPPDASRAALKTRRFHALTDALKSEIESYDAGVIADAQAAEKVRQEHIVEQQRQQQEQLQRLQHSSPSPASSFRKQPKSFPNTNSSSGSNNKELSRKKENSKKKKITSTKEKEEGRTKMIPLEGSIQIEILQPSSGNITNQSESLFSTSSSQLEHEEGEESANNTSDDDDDDDDKNEEEDDNDDNDDESSSPNNSNIFQPSSFVSLEEKWQFFAELHADIRMSATQVEIPSNCSSLFASSTSSLFSSSSSFSQHQPSTSKTSARNEASICLHSWRSDPQVMSMIRFMFKRLATFPDLNAIQKKNSFMHPSSSHQGKSALKRALSVNFGIGGGGGTRNNDSDININSNNPFNASSSHQLKVGASVLPQDIALINEPNGGLRRELSHVFSRDSNNDVQKLLLDSDDEDEYSDDDNDDASSNDSSPTKRNKNKRDKHRALMEQLSFVSVASYVVFQQRLYSALFHATADEQVICSALLDFIVDADYVGGTSLTRAEEQDPSSPSQLKKKVNSFRKLSSASVGTKLANELQQLNAHQQQQQLFATSNSSSSPSTTALPTAPSSSSPSASAVFGGGGGGGMNSTTIGKMRTEMKEKVLNTARGGSGWFEISQQLEEIQHSKSSVILTSNSMMKDQYGNNIKSNNNNNNIFALTESQRKNINNNTNTNSNDNKMIDDSPTNLGGFFDNVSGGGSSSGGGRRSRAQDILRVREFVKFGVFFEKFAKFMLELCDNWAASHSVDGVAAFLGFISRVAFPTPIDTIWQRNLPLYIKNEMKQKQQALQAMQQRLAADTQQGTVDAQLDMLETMAEEEAAIAEGRSDVKGRWKSKKKEDEKSGESESTKNKKKQQSGGDQETDFSIPQIVIDEAPTSALKKKTDVEDVGSSVSFEKESVSEEKEKSSGKKKKMVRFRFAIDTYDDVDDEEEPDENVSDNVSEEDIEEKQQQIKTEEEGEGEGEKNKEYEDEENQIVDKEQHKTEEEEQQQQQQQREESQEKGEHEEEEEEAEKSSQTSSSRSNGQVVDEGRKISEKEEEEESKKQESEAKISSTTTKKDETETDLFGISRVDSGGGEDWSSETKTKKQDAISTTDSKSGGKKPLEKEHEKEKVSSPPTTAKTTTTATTKKTEQHRFVPPVASGSDKVAPRFMRPVSREIQSRYKKTRREEEDQEMYNEQQQQQQQHQQQHQQQQQQQHPKFGDADRYVSILSSTSTTGISPQNYGIIPRYAPEFWHAHDQQQRQQLYSKQEPQYEKKEEREQKNTSSCYMYDDENDDDNNNKEQNSADNAPTITIKSFFRPPTAPISSGGSSRLMNNMNNSNNNNSSSSWSKTVFSQNQNESISKSSSLSFEERNEKKNFKTIPLRTIRPFEERRYKTRREVIGEQQQQEEEEQVARRRQQQKVTKLMIVENENEKF